jgi:phenylpropionate dioxygenase-like ring-hydroxylating dioxygenase large terminal subunit
MDPEQMKRERVPLEKLEPGLPASWYRDPAHHQRELDVFWYARWIAVAREEEIAAPGDWKLVRIGAQSPLPRLDL